MALLVAAALCMPRRLFCLKPETPPCMKHLVLLGSHSSTHIRYIHPHPVQDLASIRLTVVVAHQAPVRIRIFVIYTDICPCARSVVPSRRGVSHSNPPCIITDSTECSTIPGVRLRITLCVVRKLAPSLSRDTSSDTKLQETKSISREPPARKARTMFGLDPFKRHLPCATRRILTASSGKPHQRNSHRQQSHNLLFSEYVWNRPSQPPTEGNGLSRTSVNDSMTLLNFCSTILHCNAFRLLFLNRELLCFFSEGAKRHFRRGRGRLPTFRPYRTVPYCP